MSLLQDKKTPIEWFRDAAPYIHSHRGKTFVVFIAGQSVEQDNFTRLIKDISLLHSLDIKVVIVHGARAQIDYALEQANIPVQIINGLRVTDDETLAIVKQTVSDIRLKIEAALSIGLGNTQVSEFEAKVASGNFIKSKPIGVIEGTDFIHTGSVRKVDANKINELLEQNSMVLLSSLGFSASGEIFNLNAEDVATQTAIDIQADKLIILGAACKVTDARENKTSFLNTSETTKLIEKTDINEESKRNLQSAITACQQGISRVHLLNSKIDGILLEELFTPNGMGLLISDAPYEKIRQATKNDVTEILSLIRPLQDKGVLVPRQATEISKDINHFHVLEQDEKIIGVVALYVYSQNIGEIACVAVKTNYQKLGYGTKLIKFIEAAAIAQGLSKLFVLSTQTAHWFMEHAYQQTEISKLPIAKQKLYNYARNSKPFIKNL